MNPNLLRTAFPACRCPPAFCCCRVAAWVSRPALAKHYYLLHVPAPKDDAAPAHRFAIRVTGFEVAPPFADNSLVYRLGDERYESDFYNEFFVAPRSMITSRVTEWLTARRIFSTVLSPSSTLDAPYSMEGLVNAMYGDFRNSAEPSAVFSMQAFITQTSTPEHRIVFEHAYSADGAHSGRQCRERGQGVEPGVSAVPGRLETDLRALELKP